MNGGIFKSVESGPKSQVLINILSDILNPHCGFRRTEQTQATMPNYQKGKNYEKHFYERF